MLEHVILTLTAIETSGDHEEGFQSSKKTDERDDDAFASEAAAQRAYEQATLTETKDQNPKTKPVTSGIRRTLRYLYALDGVTGIFRGARIMFFWSLGRWLVGLLVSYAFFTVGLTPNSRFDSAVTDLLVTLLLSPLSIAWNHRVISRDLCSSPTTPSFKRPATFGRLFHPSTFLKLAQGAIAIPRMPSRSALKAQLLPCAMAGGIQFLYHVLPNSFISPLFGRYIRPEKDIRPKLDFSSGDWTIKPGRKANNNLFAAFTLFLYVEYCLITFCAWMLHGAAAVSLTRVQASLLSEDLQTVIPADRRLGVGLVASKQMARRDKWNMLLEAWASCSWSTLRRYAKNYVKAVVIALVATFPFHIIIATSEGFVPGHRLEIKSWPPWPEKLNGKRA